METKEFTPMVGLRLSDVVKNDMLVNELGLNPWCVAEGADGDKIIQVPVSLAKESGLI